MGRRVLCGEFSSRGEAEIVRELLLASGIDSFVSSDDCGSVDPALAFARGVQLYVSEENAAEAELIIAEARADSPEGALSADE